MRCYKYSMSVYKKNGKYYCRFQIDGERHHYLCNGATTEKEARKIEDGFRYKVQQQQNGIISKKEKNLKFSVLIDLYCKYSKTNNKAYKNNIYFLKTIINFFGNNTNSNKIQPKDIEAFKEYLKNTKKLKNSSINRYLHVLSRIFSLGKSNKLVLENPVKYVKQLLEENHKIRFLTLEEEKRLFEVIQYNKSYLYPIVVCALQTGMRKSEILNLKWENIDFEYRFIELLETKSGKSRKIPISETLWKILNNQKIDNEYIFTNPDTKTRYKDIKKSWDNLLKDAKIENFRFHDLRHTVATRLVEKGIDLVVVKEILGHSKIETTIRYAHAVPKRKLEAIDVLNSYN